MNLYLKEPTLEDKAEVIKMFNELENCGDEYPFEGAGRLDKLHDVSYEEWLQICEADKTIEKVNPSWSNGTNYLLVDENNHVYGYSQLRHSLKGNLINIGGNIGYAIKPSERRKGYATIQLKLLLEKANELGFDKVLVTCRDNNIGSRKTIEKCFGVQDKSVPSKYPNIMELRYWINTKTLKNNTNNYGSDNMNKDVIIETDRLILRQYRIEDADDVVEGLNNINVTKWLQGAPYPYTKEDALHFINKSIDNNLYNFAIVLKSEDKVIGGTQLTNIDMHNGTAGGGIWISEKYWGCGYGTEAFGARIKYAFEVLGLRRLENGYFKGNEKSHKMQLRFGYKDEGIRRQKFVSRGSGKIEDEYITGLLKDEWIK